MGGLTVMLDRMAYYVVGYVKGYELQATSYKQRKASPAPEAYSLEPEASTNEQKNDKTLRKF